MRQLISDEFSHTVLHGGQQLGKGAEPRPLPARPMAPPSALPQGHTPAERPGVKKYNPASVYGAPPVGKASSQRCIHVHLSS